MPRCEGRPDGPCPENRNDRTVRLTQGDLMLCEACDRFRFPQSDAAKRTKSGKGKKDTSAIIPDVGRSTAAETQLASKTSSTSATASGHGPPSPPLIVGELLTTSVNRCLHTGTSPCPDKRSDNSDGDGNGAADKVKKIRQQAEPSGSDIASTMNGRRNPTDDITSDASQTTNITSRVVQLSAVVGTTNAKKVILNELLAYVNCYRHNSTEDSLRKVVLVHFSQDDIAAAKRLLIQEFQSTSGVAQFTLDRRDSTIRQAHEAEVDDIIAIFDVVDTRNLLTDYLFVASNLQTMPKYGPEEINLAVVVDRQVQMDAAIANLSSSVEKLSRNAPTADSSSAAQHSVADDIQQQLGAFGDAIGARLDHLSSVCTQLAENAKPRNVVYTSPRAERKSHDVERSMNVMVFGVAENRDVRVWRRVVDRALQFVMGSAVDVKDMLRIGRYTDGKIRPIVVKLRTSWDRRIILAESGKLKDFEERIFFAADEPIEERRKKMLERMKSRAESNGQVASVVDGKLFVDGTPVFSLKDGKINQDGVH